MKSNRLRRDLLALPLVLICATNVEAEQPIVHVEYQTRVDATGGIRYVFAEGTMSGTVRGSATYRVPVQIHYPVEGGNGTAVLELTNSALLFFHLAARGDRPGDRRSESDDVESVHRRVARPGAYASMACGSRAPSRSASNLESATTGRQSAFAIAVWQAAVAGGSQSSSIHRGDKDFVLDLHRRQIATTSALLLSRRS